MAQALQRKFLFPSTDPVHIGSPDNGANMYICWATGYPTAACYQIPPSKYYKKGLGCFLNGVMARAWVDALNAEKYFPDTVAESLVAAIDESLVSNNPPDQPVDLNALEYFLRPGIMSFDEYFAANMKNREYKAKDEATHSATIAMGEKLAKREKARARRAAKGPPAPKQQFKETKITVDGVITITVVDVPFPQVSGNILIYDRLDDNAVMFSETSANVNETAAGLIGRKGVCGDIYIYTSTIPAPSSTSSMQLDKEDDELIERGFAAAASEDTPGPPTGAAQTGADDSGAPASVKQKQPTKRKRKPKSAAGAKAGAAGTKPAAKKKRKQTAAAAAAATKQA